MTTAALDLKSSAPQRALSNKGLALGALAGAVGNVVLFFIGAAAGVSYVD